MNRFFFIKMYQILCFLKVNIRGGGPPSSTTIKDELDRGESVAEFANSRGTEQHQREQSSSGNVGGGWLPGGRHNAAFGAEDRSLGGEMYSEDMTTTMGSTGIYDKATSVRRRRD